MIRAAIVELRTKGPEMEKAFVNYIRLILETNFRKDRRDFGLTRGVDEGAYPQRSGTEEQRSVRAKDQGISEICFENQSSLQSSVGVHRTMNVPAVTLHYI